MAFRRQWPAAQSSDWLGTESDFEIVWKPLAPGFGPVEWTNGLDHHIEQNRPLHVQSVRPKHDKKK